LQCTTPPPNFGTSLLVSLLYFLSFNTHIFYICIQSLFGSSDDGLTSLRQKMSEKDLELEILKAELALVTSQRDHLMKTVK